MVKFKLIFWLIAVFYTFESHAQYKKSEVHLKDLKACWKIKDIVYEQSGGIYTEADIVKLKGKLICFNKDTLNIIGDTVLHANYSVKRISTEQFIKSNFNAYYDNLKKYFKISADSVTILNVNGISYTTSSKVKIKQSTILYEFAFDGHFLYLPNNGAMFRLTKL